jgi:glycosyltransferase involved in cell wall biosynthesis
MSPAPPQRLLAGATILQLVPALRDDSVGRTAVDIARALLQSGARAMVAGKDGPLVDELAAIGGEFLPMATDTFNPLRIHANARRLVNLIGSERIDIVHAQSVDAARSALAAARQMPVFLVTSFPDLLPGNTWPSTEWHRPLARGHRVIAPSNYASRVIIERYKIAPDRVSVIPRAVDTAAFDPAAVSNDRIEDLREDWGILPGTRVVLVRGPITPRNGQLTMIDVARLLAGGKIAFIFEGDDDGHWLYTRRLRRQASVHGIDHLCRMVGPCPDMPAALALADVVVVPALQPPRSGQATAEAQAMGRPVVASAVGNLPDTMLCPPRMREDLRTGWLVTPGAPEELALAVGDALALDVPAYTALSGRARQFAEFAFSPPNVAEVFRGRYTSLLARDV